MPENTSNILPIVFESVIIFQIIYIALQWFYIRKTEYLYYLGYMVVMGIYVYFLYLPFNVSHYHPIVLDKTLPILGYILYYRFARYFVDMAQILPILNSWMKRLEYVLAIYILIEILIKIFNIDENISEYTFNAVSILLFITSLVFIIYFSKKKIKLTYYLIIGAIALNIGSFGSMILITMQINGNFNAFDPFWPFAVATIFDLITFTTGLAYKSKVAVKESLKIQIEYNKNLNQNLLLNQQLHEIKDNFAQGLHSDLITAFSNINIYSGLAKKEIMSGDSNKTLQHLNKISHTGTTEIQRINDLVWCVNPENNTLKQLKSKLLSIWAEKDAAINLDIRTQEECQSINFDISFLMEIIQIVRKLNVTANISPKIYLSCVQDGAEISIECSTNGNENLSVNNIKTYSNKIEQNPAGNTIIKITTIRD